MILITVNGQVHDMFGDEETSLLWVLRDHLGLVGIKYSCGIGERGDSRVLLDGESELFGQVKLGDVSGQQMTTISVGI
jgi:isoquinoline 1-oxidoreductase alpha subunit